MLFGKKQLEQLAAYTSSVLAYGAATAIFTVYFTDWKAIVAYIPFYNGQFEEEKEKVESGCE